MIAELAKRTFQARDTAHMAHWRSKSYAEHCALGAFYDDAITAIDAIVENYQGMLGKIGSFEVCTSKVTDIVSYLQEEMDWIESNREAICEGSQSLGNLVDVLTSVYSKTLFLLSLK